MTETPVHTRYVELDAARGIAISMMVIFHLVFDLSFFSLYPVETSHGFWRLFGYTTAALFVSIAGVAVTLRAERAATPVTKSTPVIPFIRRGVFLIGVGFLVTLGTFVFLRGEGYVLFGILQLIGTSTILAPLFFRFGRKAAIPGVIIILTGWVITLPTGPIWLLWTGVHPADYISVDYTPLIPWFGVFLIGMAAGFWLYPLGRRSFRVPSWADRMLYIPSLPGKHSLIIYLVHQPILLFILTVVYGKIPGLW
ncbi:heparan-alpha-glucosaminide N-acetyltransferase [Methanospirillum lacunae]|uniref:Heparan-alpha-glucosaminide N-acetyltransferase catalytic domain-containing protein n=1 Tax=Methanospirillum lacunae TaxID=668570 RepID=A0A2V2N8G1_9EURY|nr:heparan-alpha-glucosaminide N-acetyltransferase [Methanospirillum lacunae]PWR72798.1 hypothetical protein DK846_07565 [Methanospirillum lacunae]